MCRVIVIGNQNDYKERHYLLHADCHRKIHYSIENDELAEKLERLAEINVLLNMDEKGDDAIGMDDEATESEKPQKDVKSVDNKKNEVADMPAKQSNLGKTVTDSKLPDRPAERISLQERLAAMKARVSGTPVGRDAADKMKRKEEVI